MFVDTVALKVVLSVAFCVMAVLAVVTSFCKVVIAEAFEVILL